MCARYEVEDAPELIAEELDATLGGEITPRRTIAPTDVAPALITMGEARVLVPMKFGWPPSRPKERIHLNTRSEGLARDADALAALTTRRCLIPAHAFHEWSGPKGARLHHLFSPDGAKPLLTMAGLYLPSDDGESPARFVILTTAASREVRPFHHRMPLVVPSELRARWITTGDGDPEGLLREVRHHDAPHLHDREHEVG